MQHSNLPPVIHVFMFNGQPVNVRRQCGGTLDEAAAAFVTTMLPQNTTTQKERNHAILGTGARDTARRLPTVAAGHVGGVGDGVRGSEAGQ